ncbi:anhydro-N-acetylmuramic acid kinase [Pseudoalteromonas piscicida]|uniref:anhydro-N-acetylmuramic acid kinase n=1 Tax=Pseudoalteromonas piscicida TaxID=43662 RepID=UPI0032C03F2A
MKTDIIKLATIAEKKTKYILGLMSGTSLDGLDIALCKIEGVGKNTQLTVEQFTTIEYNSSQKQLLSDHASKSQVNLKTLCQLNAWLGELYASLINNALAEWQVAADTVDLIASHGQTLYHCPKQAFADIENLNSTLQIVDADIIATKTNIITIADFRQKHIAKGYEGAPLVQYGDYLLYSDTSIDRVLLNIGGISNLTYLPQNCALTQSMCSDIGPGNTLVDQYCRHVLGLPFDENGEIASSGKIQLPFLEALLSHEFFDIPLPKSTGQELFNQTFVHHTLDGKDYNHEDIITTLTEFTAITVANAVNKLSTAELELYVSGGGIHNVFLMERIESHLNNRVLIKDFSQLGINPDAKEAALFALLANETVSGDGDALPFSMGKISLPT